MSDKKDSPKATIDITQSIGEIQKLVEAIKPTEIKSSTTAVTEHKIPKETREKLELINQKLGEIKKYLYAQLVQLQSDSNQTGIKKIRNQQAILDQHRKKILKKIPNIQKNKNYAKKYPHIKSSVIFSLFKNIIPLPGVTEKVDEILGFEKKSTEISERKPLEKLKNKFFKKKPGISFRHIGSMLSASSEISVFEYIQKFGIKKINLHNLNTAILATTEIIQIESKQKYDLKNYKSDAKIKKNKIYIEFPEEKKSSSEPKLKYHLIGKNDQIYQGDIALSELDIETEIIPPFDIEKIPNHTSITQKIKEHAQKQGYIFDISKITPKIDDFFKEISIDNSEQDEQKTASLTKNIFSKAGHYYYHSTLFYEITQGLGLSDEQARTIDQYIQKRRENILAIAQSTASTPETTPPLTPKKTEINGSGSDSDEDKNIPIQTPLKLPTSARNSPEHSQVPLLPDQKDSPAPDSCCTRVKRGFGTFSCIVLAGAMLTGVIGLPLGFTKQPTATHAGIAKLPGGSETMNSLSHSLAAQILIPIAVALLLSLMAYGSYRLARSEPEVSNSHTP